MAFTNFSPLQQLFRERRPDRLAKGDKPTIVGDVFIHPTANVHPSAVVTIKFYILRVSFLI